MKTTLAFVLLLTFFPGLISCVARERVVVRERAVVRETDIPERISVQQRRIDQGIDSGQLTRRESAIVQDNLNYIRAEYSRANAAGRLIPREIARLERLLDRNDGMIYREKHNLIKRIY